jgi:hypothetical protein
MYFCNCSHSKKLVWVSDNPSSSVTWELRGDEVLRSYQKKEGPASAGPKRSAAMLQQGFLLYKT